MRSDSVKNMSAYADQNHAPSLTDVRLESFRLVERSVLDLTMEYLHCRTGHIYMIGIPVPVDGQIAAS